jgi:hypothetical protein
METKDVSCEVRTECILLRHFQNNRLEAGSNTSTVTLRVVGGDEKGTQYLGYNWATLFLGHINMGTWASRLGKSWIWDSKIWSRVPRDPEERMTALTRTSSNYKRQTHPLIREGAPRQQNRKYLTVTKIWPWASDGCLTPRYIGRLTRWS